VNVGPRGTYVNLSAHGISYRRKISGSAVPVSKVPQLVPAGLEEVYNIASADIGQLTDSDSKDFIAELTKKSGMISFVNWFGVFPLIVFLAVMLFTSFSSETEVTRPASDSTLIRVTSEVGVYIRKAPYAGSAVLKAAGSGQTFLLLDSGNSKWLKVGFNDTAGYISRRFAGIEHVHHDQLTGEQSFFSNPFAGYELV